MNSSDFKKLKSQNIELRKVLNRLKFAVLTVLASLPLTGCSTTPQADPSNAEHTAVENAVGKLNTGFQANPDLIEPPDPSDYDWHQQQKDLRQQTPKGKPTPESKKPETTPSATATQISPADRHWINEQNRRAGVQRSDKEELAKQKIKNTTR